MRIGRGVVGVLVVALSAACLAACKAETGPGLGKPLAGQTVEVAAVWSGVEQAHFRAVLDSFAAKTGAKVKYTSGGNDLAALINSRLAGGAPPDVALIAQPGVVAQLAQRGAIKELTGDAAAAITANYSPAWRALGVIDGRLYG